MVDGIALAWFTSYMKNRSFTVTINGKDSSPEFLWYGLWRPPRVNTWSYPLYIVQTSDKRLTETSKTLIQPLMMISAFSQANIDI